jgi:hypothetical protein
LVRGAYTQARRRAIQQHRKAAWGVVAGEEAGDISHAGRLDCVFKLSPRSHCSIGIPHLDHPVAVNLDALVVSTGLTFARRGRLRSHRRRCEGRSGLWRGLDRAAIRLGMGDPSHAKKENR